MSRAAGRSTPRRPGPPSWRRRSSGSRPTDSPGPAWTPSPTAARVTKGAVYHHFRDKAELFEAAFVVMEQRLLAKVAAGVEGIDRPVGADGGRAWTIYLEECSRAALPAHRAGGSAGRARLGPVEGDRGAVLPRPGEGEPSTAMAGHGAIQIPAGDLMARMLLAAMTEAGLAVAGADRPDEERRRTGALVMRLVEGLR